MSDWKKELNIRFFAGIPMEDMGTNQIDEQKLQDFIAEKLAAQRKQTDDEWLHGLRCHNCGHKKDSQVSDLCIRCLETA